MYHVYYLVYRPFAATVCTRRAPKNAREKLRKRGSFFFMFQGDRKRPQ